MGGVVGAMNVEMLNALTIALDMRLAGFPGNSNRAVPQLRTSVAVDVINASKLRVQINGQGTSLVQNACSPAVQTLPTRGGVAAKTVLQRIVVLIARGMRRIRPRRRSVALGPNTNGGAAVSNVLQSRESLPSNQPREKCEPHGGHASERRKSRR